MKQLLLFSIASLFSLHWATAQCDHPDRDPLILLYQATEGNKWIDNSGWSNGNPGTNCDPCDGTWVGITCNSNNRVTKIDLDRNNLSGPLPSALSEMELETLILSNNNLRYCLEPELLDLCTIDKVDISNNPLMPWQGDFQRFCNGDQQIGAPCVDDDMSTSDDIILPNCCCSSDSLPKVEFHVANDIGAFCASADLSIQLTADGEKIGTPFNFQIFHDNTCRLFTNQDFNKLNYKIRRESYISFLDVDPSVPCYEDIIINLDDEANGFQLILYPNTEDYNVDLLPSSPVDVCGGEDGYMTIQVTDFAGNDCGIFDIPAVENNTCFVLDQPQRLVSSAELLALLFGSYEESTACIYDYLIFSPGLVYPTGTFEGILNVSTYFACSGQKDIAFVELIAPDETFCNIQIPIDAPENKSCGIISSLEITITSDQIKEALGYAHDLCDFPSIVFSEPDFRIFPEAPTDFKFKEAFPENVCGGENDIIGFMDVIGPDGVSVCQEFPVPSILNEECDPIYEYQLDIVYTTNDWLENIGGNLPECYVGLSFQEDIVVNVFPAPFSKEIIGNMQCEDPVSVSLIAADGTECWKKETVCRADNEEFEYDFFDDGQSDGIYIPWHDDQQKYLNACDLEYDDFAGVLECIGCPAICDYDNIPTPSQSCLDVNALCDLQELTFVSCTAPLPIEDIECEPEVLCGGGVPSNMTWFSFYGGNIPNTDTPSPIVITVFQIGNCLGSSQGIRAGIYDACPCDGGVCITESAQCPNSFATLTVPFPQIGKEYFLFIDGCDGAQCFYEMVVQSGEGFSWYCPDQLTSQACDISAETNIQNSYCMQNGEADVYIEIPNYLPLDGLMESKFTFSISSANGSVLPFNSPFTADHPFLDLKFTSPDLYTLCFEKAENLCNNTDQCQSLPECIEINIVEIENQVWPGLSLCYSDVAEFGFSPAPLGDGTIWEGPNIYPEDLDLNGCYSYELINDCGCTFSQNICLDLIDQLSPEPYNVFVCEGEEWCSNGIFGTECFEAGELVDELFYLPGLSPNGCALPLLLTIYELRVAHRIDTIALTCESIELRADDIDPNAIANQIEVGYQWQDAAGNTLGTNDNFLFTTSGSYALIYTYSATEYFGDEILCEEQIVFDIQLSGEKTFFLDGDSDGFGDDNNTLTGCSPPPGYVVDNTDCDDDDPNINPDAMEIPNNAIDENCDGNLGITDSDGDGFDSNEDCDDNNPDIYPGAVEICNNLDDNCNGVIDDGLNLISYFFDGDGDGYGTNDNSIEACLKPQGYTENGNDCNDDNPNINPNVIEVPYNGIDDDCNPLTLDDDIDQDGFPNVSDCDDQNAGINPDAIEICDALDNDCDGIIDNGVLNTYYWDQDGDGYGSMFNSVDACEAPPGAVDNNLDCNDGNGAIHPGAPEICNNIDDNCDGSIDEGVLTTFYWDEDGDGFGSMINFVEACQAPPGVVSNNMDCDDGNPLINPDAVELCNDLDDNCDGLIDEDLIFVTYYLDLDGDGFGDLNTGEEACEERLGSVTNGEDCDDSNADINPLATEIPGNGIDEDCDGMDGPSDVHDQNGHKITISPNPVIDILNIEADINLNLEYTIISYDGQKLQSGKIENGRLSMGGFSKGIYIIQFYTEDGQVKIIEKIVKL